MPKRLTATELGDDGSLPFEARGRKLLIEVTVSDVHGTPMVDILVGNRQVRVPAHSLRRAAIEAEMDEPDTRQPVAYLRDLDGTGSLHVCARGDLGAIPVFDE